MPGSVSSPLNNGEKGVFWNQNAGFTALASPVRREIGNRHGSNPLFVLFFCYKFSVVGS